MSILIFFSAKDDTKLKIPTIANIALPMDNCFILLFSWDICSIANCFFIEKSIIHKQIRCILGNIQYACKQKKKKHIIVQEIMYFNTSLEKFEFSHSNFILDILVETIFDGEKILLF